MLNSAFLDLMMSRLGRRQAAILRGLALLEVNQAIRELERAPTKPWFLEDTLLGTTIANQEYITLPTDFLMEPEEGTFEVQHLTDGWKELLKVSRERIRQETKNASPAFPEGYAIWGQKMIFGPSPDAAYSYRLDYYKRTSTFADNGSEVTNPWLIEFPNYIMYSAMIIMARDHIQNDRMAQNATTQFQFAESHFMKEVEARRISGETLLLTNEET